MKLIVCLDDKNGMMFNKRRQSRDRVLIENVLELCKGEKLYTNEYSSKLFPENSVEVFDSIENVGNEYCFAENFTVNEENIEEIIVYKWNRLYPADTYFKSMDICTSSTSHRALGLHAQKNAININSGNSNDRLFILLHLLFFLL